VSGLAEIIERLTRDAAPADLARAGITFAVPGRPCAKQSVRFTRSGHRYQPADVVEYRSRVAVFARQAWPHEPLDGPIEMEVVALFLKPASWPRKRREAAYRHIGRPDGDNLGKAGLDGCKAILFRDDAQVSDLIVRKRWSDHREELQITVRSAS
jgi:Holliday junction resolvase RusA-like endonuclease